MVSTLRATRPRAGLGAVLGAVLGLVLVVATILLLGPALVAAATEPPAGSVEPAERSMAGLASANLELAPLFLGVAAIGALLLVLAVRRRLR